MTELMAQQEQAEPVQEVPEAEEEAAAAVPVLEERPLEPGY